MVFMDTAVTIPTGAMAERWKWASFVVFALFMGAFVYPIFANWVWGTGWLSSLGRNFGLGHGHVDFAGSSVVHMVGGVAALAGAIVLGPGSASTPRAAKRSPSWPRPADGHHRDLHPGVRLVRVQPGSTLAGGDLRIGVVATNTMMAGTAGAWWRWSSSG
jgi:Amt family ammonium transporter